MALSKSVNYFVNTIYYDPIAIGALNTNDSEAIQSTLPHRAAKICLQSPKSAEGQKERSAEHDVAGITARIDTTFENILLFLSLLLHCLVVDVAALQFVGPSKLVSSLTSNSF